MSLQTQAIAPALADLLQAKGDKVNATAATVKPIATEVITENPATPAPELEEEAVTSTETTQVQDQDPVDDKKDIEARYKELKKHHDRTVYELRNQVKELTEKVETAVKPDIKTPKTKKEMEEFKEKYPEAYDAMRATAVEYFSEIESQFADKFKEVTQTQQELRAREAFNELLKLHPDADEIRTDERFLSWYNDQPGSIRAILNSTDAQAIAKQITLYKLEVLGINPKEKKKQIAKANEDASLGVKVKGQVEVAPAKKIWTGSEINKISANYKEWLKHKDEIDLARREKRVDFNK